MLLSEKDWALLERWSIREKIGILGGGLTDVSLGYFLNKKGYDFILEKNRGSRDH